MRELHNESLNKTNVGKQKILNITPSLGLMSSSTSAWLLSMGKETWVFRLIRVKTVEVKDFFPSIGQIVPIFP